MRPTALLLLSLLPLLADNQEKAEKKLLDQQAKAFVQEAKLLEKSGKLLEARAQYAKSQSFLESKDALNAIKRIDTEIQSRAKVFLRQAHQSYDRGDFKAAAQILQTGAGLGASGAAFSYNLALCNRRLGDTATALGQLDDDANATADPKRKLKIRQLRTLLITGEQPAPLKNENRAAADNINRLIEQIGFESSLDENPPSLPEPSPNAPAASRKLPTGSLCQALAALQGPLASAPSITFNLANCAEDNDRPADASRLLTRYLEQAPAATDADRVRLRILKLNALATLPGDPGTEVRTSYAASTRFLQHRKYADALTGLQQAALAAPEFAETKWRLALMYEAMGDVDHASELLSDLLNRAMNLTFNGLEDRASQYKQRAKDRVKASQKHKVAMVGGFTVPFAYAQQQLAEAGRHLGDALMLFL